MCFKRVFDSALKSAVRYSHSVDELLEHADVKDKWEKCQVKEEDGAKAAAVAVASENQDGNVVSLVQGPTALQHPLANKVVTAPVSLSDSDEVLVAEVEKQCLTKIQSLLSTINFAKPPARGETSETVHSVTSLATALRSVPVMDARGTTDTAVVVVYDIESSGEQAHCPRRSQCPLRKAHLETSVQAVLIARSDCQDIDQAAQMLTDGEAAALAPDQSDVPLSCRFCVSFHAIKVFKQHSDSTHCHCFRFLFFDGGRSSHHANFCNTFKAIGGLKWKPMYLVYSESSHMIAPFELNIVSHTSVR